jgi:hypothetical protein
MDDERRMDDELLSIEDEFAELDAELKRLAAMPVETPEQKNAMLLTLEALRADWQARVKADAPAWRRAVDEAVAKGFDGLAEEVKRAGQGNEHFQLDAPLIQKHLAPVIEALADGLKRNLVEKFGKRPPPGAPQPKVDGADVAAMFLTLFGPPKKK